jgi:uncharacterized LabA/DUF88 family protein
MPRIKFFFDFWNFQLDWNKATKNSSTGTIFKIPWEDLLPKTIITQINLKRTETLTYAGTHVYGSVHPAGDTDLRRFLHAMESFPGYTVLVKERKSKRGGVRCTSCQNQITHCPTCNAVLKRTIEKGIDAAIITDMIQMAYDRVYDVGVLGSTDADLCPAVAFIFQRIGIPIYNLWFHDGGHSLRNACYDHVKMADVINAIRAAQTP